MSEMYMTSQARFMSQITKFLRMKELSGFWSFKEEFEFGVKTGEMHLFQTNDKIEGTLSFKEEYPDDEPLFVRCSIIGELRGDRFLFHDASHTVLYGGDDDDYLPEVREGSFNVMGQIVGTTDDKDEVSGVFVMERLF
jgi:uncharacterized protein YdeI (BOF family)